MTTSAKRKAYDKKEATRELRRREYNRIRTARMAIDAATAEINDALTRLEYLLNERSD